VQITRRSHYCDCFTSSTFKEKDNQCHLLGAESLSLRPHFNIILPSTRNRGTSVVIATGFMIGVQFPTDVSISSSPQRPDRLWGPPSLLSNGHGGPFSGGKADHSPPSRAEVKNGGTLPPLPHMSSGHTVKLIKHRENFTFYPQFTCW
jgi:hypothetical protein